MPCKVAYYDGVNFICDKLKTICPFKNQNGKHCIIAIQGEEEEWVKKQVPRDHGEVD